MCRFIGSPGRYIQEKGLLKNLTTHINEIGSHPILIVDKNIIPFVMPSIKTSLEHASLSYETVEFSGECCMTEINRIKTIIATQGADMILGIGGGKTLDTAKAVGYFSGKPIVIVPTVASSDAPCSSLSVLYHEDGRFDRYLYLAKSPDMVLVDPEIITGAPARLLAAGMGDALSTYFEARACAESGAFNAFHKKPTLGALALAKACYETLLENGIRAMNAVKEKHCTEEVENIIEANIYLSGIGFESGGLAAAHAIAYALDSIPATRRFMHGEKVAFGTLAQLKLELKAAQNALDTGLQQPGTASTTVLQEDILVITNFCRHVGLPVSLADMGISEITYEELMQTAQIACAADSTVHHMPFAVTPTDVYHVLSDML